jgi:hypothetical protein
MIPLRGRRGDTFEDEAAMSDRSVKITQAELERAIRALKAQGLAVVRVIARPDGYAIETAPSLVPHAAPVMAKHKPVL